MGACLRRASSASHLALVAAGLPAENAQAWVLRCPQMRRNAPSALAAALSLRHAQVGAQPGVRPPAVGPGLGRDVPVQHHPADPAREQVRVGGAQERAVGDAEVVQLGLAEVLAQQVQVAGGVGGRDVPQQRAVPRGADLAELTPPADVAALLAPADGEEGVLAEERAFRGLAREALDRRARPGPSRVPAHDVVLAQQFLREEPEKCRELYRARPAGAARVEEDHAAAGRPVARCSTTASLIFGPDGSR